MIRRVSKIFTSPKAGFTLLESLLYLGLFAFLLSAFSASSMNLLVGTARLQNKAATVYETAFILQKMEAVLAIASEITYPSMGNSDKLLRSKEASGSEWVFEWVGFDVRMQRPGQTPAPLNGSGVKVAALEFSRTTSGSGQGLLKVRLVLRDIYNRDTETVWVKMLD